MQNVISYYPTYALLDSVMSYSKYDILNLYVDLKGIARQLYMADFRVNIVESTRMSRQTDESLFVSLLEFILFHKKYALKRGIKINFYIFFEQGESFYHLNVFKGYKASRKIDNIPGLDKAGKDLFVKVIQKNLELIFKTFNSIPNIRIVSLEHLECDFIPYYLIRNSHVQNGPNVCNLVYSNDHDLYQNLILGNNVYQFLKTKNKYILKKDEILKRYLKIDCDIPDEYFPLVMTILGDKDETTGKVKGIGEKTIPKFINRLVELIGGMDNLYDNVFHNKPIFEDDIENQTDDKNIYSVIETERKNSTISKNLKLVSFEMLSRYLDDPSNLSMLEKRKRVEQIINNNKFYNSNTIYSALNRIGVLTEIENPLDILYVNKDINNYEF